MKCNGEKGRLRFEIMWGQLEFSRSKHFSWARIAKLLGIWDRTLKRQREEFGYFNFRSISESGYSQIKCACMYTVDGNSRQTYTYIVLTSIWLQRYLTYLKCIWRIFLFICSIKSPQCADECSKTIFSIAIFLPRVLMCQKRQISLPVGYKMATPKNRRLGLGTILTSI